jgi:hypothetical protein
MKITNFIWIWATTHRPVVMTKYFSNNSLLRREEKKTNFYFVFRNFFGNVTSHLKLFEFFRYQISIHYFSNTLNLSLVIHINAVPRCTIFIWFKQRIWMKTMKTYFKMSMLISFRKNGFIASWHWCCIYHDSILAARN